MRFSTPSSSWNECKELKWESYSNQKPFWKENCQRSRRMSANISKSRYFSSPVMLHNGGSRYLRVVLCFRYSVELPKSFITLPLRSIGWERNMNVAVFKYIKRHCGSRETQHHHFDAERARRRPELTTQSLFSPPADDWVTLLEIGFQNHLLLKLPFNLFTGFFWFLIIESATNPLT